MKRVEPKENDVLLSVDSLKVYFPTVTGVAALFKKPEYLKAVDDINFEIKRGEVLCLVGESGSGKTTTGLAILRLVDVTDGRVLFKGENILNLDKKQMRTLRSKMQIIFQDPYESLNPRMTVFQIVSEPLRVNRLVREYTHLVERVKTALRSVRLTPPERFMPKFPHELSGGERQRVSMASALTLNPELIVADEPVSNLDVSTKAEVLNLLAKLKRELKLTYLFITHDIADAYYISDRIGVMYLGKIVEIGPKKIVVKDPVHPYTKALISVIPTPSGRMRTERIILGGAVPDPVNLPPGCRLNTRCPQAAEICFNSEPEMTRVGPNHFVACHFAKNQPTL